MLLWTDPVCSSHHCWKVDCKCFFTWLPLAWHTYTTLGGHLFLCLDRAWVYHLCLGLVSCVIVTKKMCFVWKDDELSFLELTHCLCLSTPRYPKKSMSLNSEEGSVSMRAAWGWPVPGRAVFWRARLTVYQLCVYLMSFQEYAQS